MENRKSEIDNLVKSFVQSKCKDNQQKERKQNG
jgi:hypothetical protein